VASPVESLGLFKPIPTLDRPATRFSEDMNGNVASLMDQSKGQTKWAI
jgi:hypothetical protein